MRAWSDQQTKPPVKTAEERVAEMTREERAAYSERLTDLFAMLAEAETNDEQDFAAGVEEEDAEQIQAENSYQADVPDEVINGAGA